MEETGYQIGQGKPQKVATRHQSAYTRNRGLHELITGIECIAADGWKMAPWFLVKAQNHMENWYRTTNLLSDYTIAPTPNGYTSNEIAIQWLRGSIEKTKSRVNFKEKRLLIIDNHGSHCTIEFTELATTNNIIPWYFIPHTTHLCQPLDSAPFLAPKNFYKKHNNHIVPWGGSCDRKVDFFREIQHVRDALTNQVVRSGFRKTCIWPYDSVILLDPLKEKINWGPDLVIFEDTPDREFPSSITNTPPRTVKKIRKSSQKFEAQLEALDDEAYALMKKRGRLLIEATRENAYLVAQYERDNTELRLHAAYAMEALTEKQVGQDGPRQAGVMDEAIQCRDAKEQAVKDRKLANEANKRRRLNKSPTPAVGPIDPKLGMDTDLLCECLQYFFLEFLGLV